MTSIIDRWIKKDSSAESAKQRLQLVLIHDRANLPAGKLELMKEELIRVISRYVEIDRTNVEIAVENEGREQRLLINIPLNKNKR